MTIRRGEPWGEEVPRPEHVAVASSDAELAAMVASDPGAVMATSGGDVHAALGRPSGRGATAQRLPMDLLRLSWEGGSALAVAHTVLRTTWWRGTIVAVMNVERLGTWDVAPQAHPNDGRADVVTVARSMSLRTRLAVRRRLPTGTHLPHPDIEVRRRAEGAVTVGGEADLWIDGVRHGRCRQLTFVVEPDAYSLVC